MNDTGDSLSAEIIRLAMNSVNSKFLHVWYMIGLVDSIDRTNEPRHEKTSFLHMRKQRHRSASR